MKSFGIICGLLIATTIACVFAQDINVWPLPMSFSQGSTVLSLSSSQFQFHCNGQSCSGVLTRALQDIKN